MTTFTLGTKRWFALASRMLGWRPGEFWSATPTELVGAMQDPELQNQGTAPGRELIAQMLKRDGHE